MTLYNVKQRCKRSPLASWRASIRHPLFKILCQTSMPQRQEYHCTHWVASSTVSTATVVNNSHSMGVTSAGGSTSWTWTAHSVTSGVDYTVDYHQPVPRLHKTTVEQAPLPSRRLPDTAALRLAFEHLLTLRQPRAILIDEAEHM